MSPQYSLLFRKVVMIILIISHSSASRNHAEKLTMLLHSSGTARDTPVIRIVSWIAGNILQTAQNSTRMSLKNTETKPLLGKSTNALLIVQVCARLVLGLSGWWGIIIMRQWNYWYLNHLGYYFCCCDGITTNLTWFCEYCFRFLIRNDIWSQLICLFMWTES